MFAGFYRECIRSFVVHPGYKKSVSYTHLDVYKRQGEKREAIESIAEGSVDILVGTHAMLEPQVKWANLGLVVTDEQHRFGVKQRLNLSYDTYVPHVLVMSATPIPRSLALTIYGDLDLSLIHI